MGREGTIPNATLITADQNDLHIKMSSDESHFNVSFIVVGTVTSQPVSTK